MADLLPFYIRLASTSVGTLEFRTALEPVRSRRTKVEFFQGWADAVDFESKKLTIEEAVEDPWQGRSLTGDRHEDETQVERAHEKQTQAKKGQLFDMTYDKLIIAVGCYNQTFNTKGVKENAFFLKDVGDARKIRNRLLSCFEEAALPTTSDEMRKQLLNFAVVGGGPTGIEWSAELHDLITEDMKKLYPDLVKHAHITVYDVAPTVLSMFDEKLAKYAMNHFKREGISIKTSHHVEELRTGAPGQEQKKIKDDATGYTIKLKEEGEIGIGMCVWSTGLMMNPFVANALAGKVKRDEKSGGIMTNGRLQAKTENEAIVPDVYALGDCAMMEDTSYPATAQVASQKAGWLAKRFNKRAIEQNVFTYKDLGVMAYIGNSKGLFQSSGADISGRVAWFIWRGAYLAKSVSWRNRMLIPMYWFINWAFGRDISRF
ncbi:hypothetical protein LTR37_016150 [Vermiconidia calcicola]|uniref:Uncharacterized protein n=1 Tax=Vermiconidia calcicola TaxID=1690605 RepID=A0ACC3MPQ4_9PEZI|nr:hypothetical protein LTR37_016150 [Vermiconidia calcicola]